MRAGDAGNKGALVALAVVALTAVAAWFALRQADFGDGQPAAAKPTGQDPVAQSDGWLVAPMQADPAQANKLLLAAMARVDEQPLRKRLSRATWQRSYAWPGGKARGTLLHDGEVATLRRGVEPGVEVGRRGDRCWLRRGEVVTECALEDRALLRVHQMAHDATLLLPLSQPPYEAQGWSAASKGRHSAHALFFNVQDSPWRVVALMDVDAPRIERFSLQHRQGRLKPIDCDLADLARLGGLMVPTTRRLHFFERVLPDAQGIMRPAVVVERMEGLQVGADGAAMIAPAATAEGPMRLSRRAAMLVAFADVPTGHGGAIAAFDAAETRLPAELQLVEPQWFEVIGTGGEAPGVPKRVQVWVASALYTVGAERTAVGHHLTRVQAEPVVASRVVRVPFDALPQRLESFAAEVRGAGHRIAPRPRVVAVLAVPVDSGEDPRTAPWLVELQLPLESTPATARP